MHAIKGETQFKPSLEQDIPRTMYSPSDGEANYLHLCYESLAIIVKIIFEMHKPH